MNRQFSICSFVALFAISSFVTQFACAQDKAKVPTPSEAESSEKLAREVYGDRYKKAKTRNAKSDLAREILNAGLTETNAVTKFVMLRLAKNIAINSSDIELVMETLDSIEEGYQVDPFDQKIEALTGVCKAAQVASLGELVELADRLSEQAIRLDKYDALLSYLSSLGKLASKSREKEIRKTVAEMKESIEILASVYKEVKPFQETLKKNPNDAQANLVVGKYSCFVKNDWSNGLKFLALGNDEGLKNVATAELKIKNTAKGRLAVADQWWELSEKQDNEDDKVLMVMRAGYHYQMAVEGLSGLEMAKAKKRAKEAAEYGDISYEYAGASSGSSTDVDAPSSGTLGPVQLAESQIELRLPAAFDDVVVGGSGKFLIFHLSTLNKLAFFDVMKSKITNYHSLESNDMRYSAGVDAFYVGYRGKNVLERWSLATFKKQATVILPFENPLDAVVCGAGSKGPVFVGAKHAPGGFVDGKSLKQLAYQVLDHRYNQKDAKIFGAGPESRMRASFNGQTFTNWSTNVSPAGFRAVVLSGRQAHTFYDHETVGYQMPSPDGQLIHTGRGVFTRQLKSFSGNDKMFSQSFSIPAVHGNYSVRVVRDDDGKENASATCAVTFHVNANTDVLFRKEKIRLRAGRYGDFFSRERVAIDKRVYFIPVCNLLITLPVSNQLVVMHQVNLEKELESNGKRFLYVESRPTTMAYGRKQYKYQIKAKSSVGGLRYSVESGPKGMKVSPAGVISWRAPASDIGKQHDVIIAINDSENNAITHTFKLSVE